MINYQNCVYEASTLIRVRYGETDQMGYCYYGNYAQYFEVGRVETMRELGMTYKELEKMGFILPVASYNVQYKIPARYDDLLTITTKIIDLKGVRLYFEYTIKDKDGALISSAETVLVFVDKNNRKPVKPPRAFIELLKDAKK